MEITINIPKNDYVQPTEVRQEVVQAICEAFLETHIDSTFHPGSDGCRSPKVYVMPAHGKVRAGFASAEWAHDHPEDGYIRFNGEEMKAAFHALRSAGYHMFRIYHYRTWMGYRCDKKPYYEGGTEVTEFNDFID